MNAPPRHTVRAGVIGLIALCASVLSLAGSAQAERRLALIIGNGAYRVGPLENPANDAALMADTLRGAGFEVSHLENLGYRELQRAVVTFGRDLRAAGPDTVGMVFYAGHAVQADGENYLIPVDADIQDSLDLRITTLEVSTLMASLRSAGNRLNLVVLDACRNNPFPAMSRSGSRGLAKIEAAYGTLLAFSTAPGEIAADGSGRNSPYTAALAKAIRTPGLAVEHVFKRVRVDVMEGTGNRQVPWESSSLTGDFIFVDRQPEPVVAAPQAPAPAPSNTAEIEYWKSVAASNDPAAIQTYLDAYPDGLFTALAQQRIAALQAGQAQAARSQHEAAARSAWDAVKDSDDPVLLQSIVDRYGDTVYAEIARVKLDSLAQQAGAAQQQIAALPPPAAATAPTPVNNQAELLFWESIKDSSNKSDYEAYLSRFPDGVFATIARDRALNGYKYQTAALPATAPPYDGIWRGAFDLTYSDRGDRYTKFAFICKKQNTRLDTVEIRNGRFVGALTSPDGSSRSWDTVVAPDGRIEGRIGTDIWVEGHASENTISIQLTYEMTGYGGCRGDLNLTRVAGTQTAALTSVPAAPPQHPLDGDWILTVETTIPNPNAQWCRWGEAVEESVTVRDGNLDTRVKTNMGKSAQIKMSLSEGGASYFAKPQGWGQHLFYGDLDRQGDIYQAEIFITMSNARCKQTVTLRRP